MYYVWKVGCGVCMTYVRINMHSYLPSGHLFIRSMTIQVAMEIVDDEVEMPPVLKDDFTGNFGEKK